MNICILSSTDVEEHSLNFIKPTFTESAYDIIAQLNSQLDKMLQIWKMTTVKLSNITTWLIFIENLGNLDKKK